MMTDKEIDALIEPILKAAGTSLRHYILYKSREEMREAMRAAMGIACDQGFRKGITKAMEKCASTAKWARNLGDSESGNAKAWAVMAESLEEQIGHIQPNAPDELDDHPTAAGGTVPSQ